MKTITEKQLKEARDYVPNAEKETFINYTGEKCFERLNITVNSADNQVKEFPPMYKECSELKARYLMGAFLKMYLNIDFEKASEDDMWLISEKEYDEYSQAHIFNQIERFKANASLRDKCFDLIEDYRSLEKRLNTEVYGLLQVMNDPITRLVSYLHSSITNDMISEMTKDLKKTKTELEKMALGQGKTTKGKITQQNK